MSASRRATAERVPQSSPSVAKTSFSSRWKSCLAQIALQGKGTSARRSLVAHALSKNLSHCSPSSSVILRVITSLPPLGVHRDASTAPSDPNASMLAVANPSPLGLSTAPLTSKLDRFSKRRHSTFLCLMGTCAAVPQSPVSTTCRVTIAMAANSSIAAANCRSRLSEISRTKETEFLSAETP